jgi:hypothetical protein
MCTPISRVISVGLPVEGAWDANPPKEYGNGILKKKLRH